MPVESFPPVMNMARYFADQDSWQVSLCTNTNHRAGPDFAHPAVDIVRGTYPHGRRGFGRFFAYASFHMKAWWHLVKTRPGFVLYIEPHSALPALLYWPFRRRSRLFIHYHEYHAPGDYQQPGMRMARWFHRLERKWLYAAAAWISQTNPARLALFLSDHPEIQHSKCTTLANYPPASWARGENLPWHSGTDGTIKLVYVGALSSTATYIEEAVHWVRAMSKPVTLDVYSGNLHPDTRAFLRSIADDQIRFHEGGAPYDSLPNVLRRFHAGLILYRGATPNYVHNATNKLFEYLVCGLDVIYPAEMEGVKPYADGDSVPRVIECDFRNLSSFTYSMEGRQALPKRDIAAFSCEAELGRLERAMLSSS